MKNLTCKNIWDQYVSQLGIVYSALIMLMTEFKFPRIFTPLSIII